MMANLLLASIAIVLLTSVSAEFDVGNVCKLVQPGTKLPSIETCMKYYTCIGNNMVLTSFCPENSAFDKDAQSCVPEANSNCYFGLANPCHNKNNQLTYSKNGCNWYSWCVNGQIAGNGTCPIGQKFYTANSSCIYGQCDTRSQSRVQDMCEIMPNGVFFGDFENCRGWHKCVAMNQESGLCADSLVYDVTSGFCLAMKENMCERTNNVVQGQASGPPQEPCTDVSQVVADLYVCSVYYICVIATQNPVVTYRWEERNCKTQYFDVISKTCSGTLVARPYPSCDRCALKPGYARTYWTNVVDPNCAQYYTCSNGQKVGTDVRSCKDGFYFDEAAQACLGGKERIDEYLANNGACQDYTCTDSRECSLVGTGEGGNISQPPISQTTETTNADENQNHAGDENQNHAGDENQNHAADENQNHAADENQNTHTGEAQE